MKGKRYKRELPAICLFCFLIGICLVLIFNNKLEIIKDYVDIFSSQIKNSDLSDTKIFLTVLSNRIAILIFVFTCSYIYKSKLCLYILSAFFFFLYGIFLAMNCLALGFKGVLTGFVLFVPQWLFYILGFFICIYKNMNSRSNYRLLNLFQRIMPFMLIILGSIIETYVTQPLIYKIF